MRPARTLAKKGNIPVGYYKDEKKTAETFRTINGVRYAIPGDYAQVEEDGTVTMLGRGSVSINSGGEKVYPEEVEAALKGHPDVFDALVVGVPDPRYGQQVAAVVQARPGCRPRGCCHEFRCDQHERHGRTPNHLCAGATTADMAASLSENLSCHSSNMCRLSGNAATNLERPGEEPPGDRCTRRQAVRPARTLAKKGNIPVGYYKDEKKTAETFRTINGVRYAIPGDYAQVEEDGTVTMLGRGSVSINSGGEKVYPEEVEAALKGHPDVFDALVVGVPDPRYGQQVAAVVQARPGCRPSLAELDSFVRSEIAGYKVPRSLWFVDEVKRSPAGKPDYRWAKEQTEARPADDVHAGHVTSGS